MDPLSKCYNPKDTEDAWYKAWDEHGLFSAKPDPQKEPFSIVIPPPNVTGILHMGHALNNTIQDILVRFNRMKGKEALWMPGTDHAGIATQNVVEKSLAKEGLKRQDLGRERFIEKVWLWKEQYGSTIIRQLKKLGASCDWTRIRFTMDEQYSEAVREVFVILHEKGLIYQGNYIINWCPRCQTALSDEEAPHHELQGNLYYLRYPLKDDQARYIVVATTRPETMLGDTAVAVHPKDKRYKRMIGKSIILPLVHREIKIIADDMVDTKFGTGAVKVTPAHDPNDYVLGKKHGLEFVNVMHPDARMNEQAGEYKDMDRFEAREVILEDLKEQGLLEKVEPHHLSAAHCYRCHTIIEPYLSKQWFVKMKPLAAPAIEAVKKRRIKFHPARWTKVYLNWMENIQDWCISRQIWWGHRIPVFYCRQCQKEDPAKGIIVSRTTPQSCLACGSHDIYQDEDVLDTWFSSWLWPFATFYWPFGSFKSEGASEKNERKGDLAYFYPTSVLVTAPEIIFFWVARMIMAGFQFRNDIPFKDVYIHGTVRDIEGKKMSKSLGNVIDPLEIINEYGTDALRFSLISITAQGQDVFLSKERFEQGRNFANKIWNASRFILMNLESSAIKTDLCVFFKKEDLDMINRWILSRFYSVLKETEKNILRFKFNEAASALYGFFWHEFCDWYLELIKGDIKNPHNQVVMFKILEKFLRLIHPFMPFISEEIWHKLTSDGSFIMTEPYPHLQEQMIDKKLEKQAQVIFDVIKEIRNLRNQIGLSFDQLVKVSVFAHKKPSWQLLRSYSGLIKTIGRLESFEVLASPGRPAATVSALIDNIDLYLHYTGLLDIQKEQLKIKEKMHSLENLKSSKEGRLKNKDFISKAPEEIINKEKESIEKLINDIDRLGKMLNELS